ncbi:hypothetical protein ZEAMMB73_Zm00001d020335 [Zea mays]|uniref:Uncharacterized protein n=1 Tax=Zea mays TaxID=4577 RepID=A0A1D6I3K7_MAIZE|nr:hypothetical protein ZEAMMB73_Zm00001d020335 [Zea mays]
MEAISNTRLALGILVVDIVVLVGEKVTSKLFLISRSADVRRPSPLWDLLLIHKVCFIAQFGQSIVRADYLILRKGFIMD